MPKTSWGPTPEGPFPNYHFRVDIGDLTVAEFAECSGMEMTVKTDTVRQGGQNEFTHFLPGRVEFSHLTLKRGYVRRSELFDWCMSMLNRSGKPISRKEVTIALVTPMGVEADNQLSFRTVFTWTLLGAYPVKWTGPTLKAGENAIAMETLELAHEGIQQER